MPAKLPEFYVCRVERRVVQSGVEVAWLPLNRTVPAVDASSAISSVRAELGPGVLVAMPVAQVTTAAAVQRIEMETGPASSPITP